MMRGVLLLLAALIAAGPLYAKQAVPALNDPVAEKRAVTLEQQLRCLVCQNETIAASQADLAKDLRKEIREQIKAGRTDDQIKQYLVDRYGDFVLYNPPFKATTVLLWAGPFALLLIGILTLFLYVRRRRGLVEQAALSDEQRARAQALLREGGERG